ncbi:hypothetical protein PS15m_008231 [Mucor circinelloides]
MLSSAPSNRKLSQIVLRPNVGTQGRATTIRTNFYSVTSTPSGNVYHYDIDFEPALPEKKCRAVWDAFQKNEGREYCGHTKTIFDGRKNVFSAAALKFGEDEAKQFQVDMNSSPVFGHSPKNVLTIRVKLAGVVNMDELQLFLDSKLEETPNCKTAIMVLDNLIRQQPSQTHYTFGRSIFSTEGRRPLPNGVELWQGFYQSVRPTAGKLLVNIDTSATAVFESGPVPDIVAKYLDKRSMDDLRAGIHPKDLRLVTKMLKGRTIVVNHRGERKNHFKITGLGPPADKLKFQDQDGKEMSVSSYFTAKYNKRLAYPFLPCIQVKRDIFLPMEVCELVAGQRYTAKLNGKQTSEFIKITCQPPSVRLNKISDGLKLLEHKNEYMQEFGMTVSQQMEAIKARVLKAPSIKYNTSQPLFVPQGASWSLRGKKLAKPATLKSWAVVNFAGSIPQEALRAFIREMCSTMHEFGLSVINRSPPLLSCDPQANIDLALKGAYLKAGNAAQAEPQLIMCIVPNVNSQIYGEIKRITDTVIGIPSQVIKSNNVLRPNKQYCANVTLKLNVKMGGVNYSLNNNDIPFITKKPTIILGADVNHPAPGAENSPSIAAITASMDPQATKFISAISYQSGKTEIIQDMAGMVKKMLIAFYKQNKQKPSQILFYRDGVSEGQFQAVLDEEVAAVRAACESLEKTYKPTLTFVVVQKRHHARFFPIQREDSDKNGNCLPGTVVDTNIVHPFEFDFYLQSHTAIKGTARSAKYIVLHDDNKFSADALQELTYRLCYVYGRSSCAVSVVPAAYYADIVAGRGRLHCRGGDWSGASTNTDDADTQMASYAAVNPKLNNSMYYM